MTSFAIDIASARPSLQTCIQDLNTLCAASPEEFSRLVVHTLRESSVAGGAFKEHLHLIPGLHFILGAGTKNNVAAADLATQLRAYTDLSESAVTVLCQCYDGASGASAVDKVLGLGQFVGMDWKVGVGVQSSNCDNLCAPFVSLVVRISTGGIVEATSMELSIAEFGDFATSVREMQKSMDGL